MSSQAQCWIVIAHARHHVMCTPYVKFTYFNFSLPLCHSHWAPMKNKGCSLSGPLMLKAKSREFFFQKFAMGPEDHLVWKVAIFTARRLSHFLGRSVGGGGSDPYGREGKSQKVSDSHRNDVSPLTEGLNYRSACDYINPSAEIRRPNELLLDVQVAYQ